MLSHNTADTLQTFIENLSNRPQTTRGLVAMSPADGEMTPPWITWTVLALVCYVARKRWAWGVIEGQVQALLRQNSDCYMNQQEVLDECFHGPIYACPEWEMEIEGNFSSLINKVTGETIHVDACNGPDLICDFMFIEYVEKMGSTHPAYQRLVDLHPNGRALQVCLNALRNSSLCHVCDETEFEFSDYVSNNIDAVEEFCRDWQDPLLRPALACHIGDWIAAHDSALASGNAALATFAASRAQASRRLWNQSLRQMVETDGLDETLVYGLANAQVDDLRSYLVRGLEHSGTAWAVFDVIHDDPGWCRQIFRLFLRNLSRPGSQWPIERAATYLCRHHYQPQKVVQCLLNVETRMSYATTVKLALQYAPDLVATALRRCLRMGFYEERLTAAAVLALFNTPWGQNELLAVLEESDDLDRTIECRTALMESHDPAAHEAVAAWEASHPDNGEYRGATARLMYTMHGGCQQALNRETLELTDMVQRFIAGTRGIAAGDAIT